MKVSNRHFRARHNIPVIDKPRQKQPSKLSYLLAYDVRMGVHEPPLPRHHDTPSISVNELVF